MDLNTPYTTNPDRYNVNADITEIILIIYYIINMVINRMSERLLVKKLKKLITDIMNGLD